MKKKSYLSPMTKYVMLSTHKATLDDPSVTIDGEDVGFTIGSPGDGSDQAANEESTWCETDEPSVEHHSIWDE